MPPTRRGFTGPWTRKTPLTVRQDKKEGGSLDEIAFSSSARHSPGGRARPLCLHPSSRAVIQITKTEKLRPPGPLRHGLDIAAERARSDLGRPLLTSRITKKAERESPDTSPRNRKWVVSIFRIQRITARLPQLSHPRHRDRLLSSVLRQFSNSAALQLLRRFRDADRSRRRGVLPLPGLPVCSGGRSLPVFRRFRLKPPYSMPSRDPVLQGRRRVAMSSVATAPVLMHRIPIGPR